MKVYASFVLTFMLCACATAPTSVDRDTKSWASTIVNCQSVAEISGSQSDKDVWAYERRALLSDRNGGWPSDSARLTNAVKKNKQQLLQAGSAVSTAKLAKCHQIVKAYFPKGHPAA